MSPVVGTLVDSSGRKPVLLFTTVALLMAHTVTALATNTFTIAMSKFVGSNVIGLFFLSAQTMLQDMHQSDPKKLASSTAALYALVSGGFSIGVGLSSLLPTGLHWAYAVSAGLAGIGRYVEACIVKALAEGSPSHRLQPSS